MNMNKEYRAELKQLRKTEKKLNSDYKKLIRETTRQMAALNRSGQRGRMATHRELARIQKRRAILEGRLA
jgi:hypothetical protein